MSAFYKTPEQVKSAAESLWGKKEILIGEFSGPYSSYLDCEDRLQLRKEIAFINQELDALRVPRTRAQSYLS